MVNVADTHSLSGHRGGGGVQRTEKLQLESQKKNDRETCKVRRIRNNFYFSSWLAEIVFHYTIMLLIPNLNQYKNCHVRCVWKCSLRRSRGQRSAVWLADPGREIWLNLIQQTEELQWNTLLFSVSSSGGRLKQRKTSGWENRKQNSSSRLVFVRGLVRFVYFCSGQWKDTYRLLAWADLTWILSWQRRQMLKWDLFFL